MPCLPRVQCPSTQAYTTWQVWIWRTLTCATSLRHFDLRDGNLGLGGLAKRGRWGVAWVLARERNGLRHEDVAPRQRVIA